MTRQHAEPQHDRLIVAGRRHSPIKIASEATALIALAAQMLEGCADEEHDHDTSGTP